MIVNLDNSSRRALAIGLLAIVVLTMIAAIVLPTWWFHARYDRALQDYGDQLARHTRIAATREASERSLASLRERRIHQLFLKSPSPTVAASELQDLARNAIEVSGARLISVNVPPHRDEGRYRVIQVSVQLSASSPALRKFLHTLESTQPLVLVESLAVRQTVGTGFRPAPGTEPEMFVQVDLVGHTIGGGAL